MRSISSVLFMIIIMCFVPGCRDRGMEAELADLKAQAEIEQGNKTAVLRMIEELNKGNFGIYEEICDPEYMLYSPSLNPQPLSLGQTIEFGKMLFQAFPDASYDVKGVFVERDRVIVWNTFTGTHEGEFQGIPPTGNKLIVGSILLFRFRNGKIIEEREEADMLGAMMQMGMQLSPKQ